MYFSTLTCCHWQGAERASYPQMPTLPGCLLISLIILSYLLLYSEKKGCSARVELETKCFDIVTKYSFIPKSLPLLLLVTVLHSERFCTWNINIKISLPKFWIKFQFEPCHQDHSQEAHGDTGVEACAELAEQQGLSSKVTKLVTASSIYWTPVVWDA